MNLNNDSREKLLKRENIDSIARAMTKYVFRDGPIEDMHFEGKLTQEDMKTLYIFTVNRIAGILETAFNGEWMKLKLACDFFAETTKDWDKAEPDFKMYKQF